MLVNLAVFTLARALNVQSAGCSKNLIKQQQRFSGFYRSCTDETLDLQIFHLFNNPSASLAGGAMECDQDDRVAGSLPEFGAIFMSNILTKKECLKRKIFALPSSQAEFVKHVKAGMVLFLFEFKKRQLFGVYQASSDGAMDITPHAFNYSGRRFPAQVCFTPIWYCDPLSEREFQDAIRENYFSAKKFNFGLSEDQVHRLLSLFSSRKMMKEMVPQPLSEPVIGVAGKDRRSVGDDRFELSERSYTELTENDEFNPAVFSDYHANSSVKEDEVLIDDRVNYEGKVYPLIHGDYMSKRRRIDNDDRLLENDVAEIYNYGALRTFHTDSPRDSLDELRKLAAVRHLLAVERVRNENQVDKIRNAVLSSESVMDPLDVRTADDDKFMQRNKLFNEYNMDNGFVSEYCEKPLDTSKHAIDDDRLLFDDCIQRNQNIRDIVEPMVCGDSNLSLCRQAMQVIEDHQCSTNRKLENRYHLDRDVSPFSAFDHNASLLHKTRKTTSGGRFPVNDRIQSEPNFGACSVQDLSSAKFSRPLYCDHGIIHDRKYPIVEGRVTENMVDNTFCSATSTRNAGYFESVGGRVVDNGRFRKSEVEDNQKDIHTHIGRDISLRCPLSFNQKRNLSSFSDKLLPEIGPSQPNVAYIFGPSGATFDDAAITRSTPYTPEHPNFFHGFNASMAANQNSSLVRENPHRGSVEGFYSCENRSSPYILKSKRSSKSLDIPPEYGNTGLVTHTSSGHQSSLHHEATSSFLNTSVPVNYRGSLFSKSFVAPPATDHENIEEDEGALFDYPSKSNGNHNAFDENLATASQHTSKHVPRPEMDMLAGKDFISSEAKDPSLGIYHSERDLTGYENQYFIPSNMNRQANHEVSKAPHFDSNVNRKSVFSRLTSREEFQGAEERTESGFHYHDGYMDATADEVMEMLHQSNNLSLRKLKKSIVVRQPKHGESALDEKQVRSNIEIKNSAMEKLNDSHLASEESIDEVPKETRIMDFKRRSETKKNFVGASTCNKITGANQEVGNSMKMTLKRKKLVRPVFGKAESAADTICTICSKQNSQLHVQIIEIDDKRDGEKAISICEVEMPNDNTRLNDVLVSHNHQSMDCNIKEHSNPEEQKDIEVHVLPSSSTELKQHKTSIVGLHIDSSQAPLTEIIPHKAFGIQTSVGDILSKNVDSTASSLNLEKSSSVGMELGSGSIEEKRPRMVKRKRKIINIKSSTDTVCSNQKNSRVPGQITENDDKRDYEKAISICEPEMPDDNTRLNNVLISRTHQSMDRNIKEHSNPEKQKDIEVHVLPSSSIELKQHKTPIVGRHIDSSQAPLMGIIPHKAVGNQTSVGDILSKNVDSTASSLNLEVSSSVGLELGAGCLNNPIEEKSLGKLKRKKKIIKKVIKKIIKTKKKTGMEPSQ